MGVSLQIYRIRIGTFNPSVRVKTGKEHFTKSSTLIYWNLRIGIFLLILLSFTSLMFVLSSQLKYLPKSSKCMLRATSPHAMARHAHQGAHLGLYHPGLQNHQVRHYQLPVAQYLFLGLVTTTTIDP